MTPEAIKQLIDSINKAQQASGALAFSYKSIPQGAATSVWAAIVVIVFPLVFSSR